MGLWSKLRQKFKFDLSKAEDRYRLILYIAGVIILVFVVAVGGISATMSPQFCKVCHNAMQPEYVTWQVSSHSQIRCVDCHMKQGVVNILIEKMAAMGHLKDYATGHYKEALPLKMKHALEDSFCTRCHSPENRNFTVSGDLIVPHEKHGDAGVTCVKCHSGVAHGNIATRYKGKLNHESDLSVWTADKEGKDNMKKEYTQPDMDTCIACHMKPASFGVKRDKPVTFKCEACHKSIFTPQSHKQKTFITTHGLDAAKNLKFCQSCHDLGVTITEVKTGRPVVDYAWGNNFCAECHAKTPANHTAGWRKVHGQTANAKGLQNCLACHNQDAKNAKADAPARTTCYMCH